MLFRTRHLDTRRSHVSTRLAAAGAAALLLGACGGGTDDAEPATDAADEQEAADEGLDVDDGLDDDTDEGADDGMADGADADDAADDGAGDDGAGDDAADDAGTGSLSGGVGTPIEGELIVAGITYEPEEALVCEDDDAFPLDVELEFQVFARGPDGPGQLDVFISEIGADVSWAGEEGIFGDGLADSDIAFTGDRVSGTATVTDAVGFEDTLDISFDLEVPATTFQCR